MVDQITPAVLEPVRRLADLRHRDPAALLAEVRASLVSEVDPHRAAMLAWAEGVALHELGRPREAIRSYRAAAAAGAELGDGTCEALARSSLAISFVSVGNARAARQQIAAAEAVATPRVQPTVEMLRGLVLQRTGALDAALVAYERALPELRRARDRAGVARLLLNRATLHAYRGELIPALTDLHTCERLAAQLHLGVLVAMAAHNTGFIEGRRGDVVSGLAAFERARRAYAALGDPVRLVAVLESDRCELLLECGLADDARGAAESAIAALAAAHDQSHVSEARLLLARSCLAQGDLTVARREAEDAAGAFRRARRRSWAALADYVSIQAEVLATQDDAADPPPRLLRRCVRIARQLTTQGWRVEGLHVRTYAGRVALALGRLDEARAELTEACRARHRGTASSRARGWHATALLRLAEGNTVGAKRALRRGMAVVEEHRAVLGATELRAHAAGHGADLARLGLQLALRDGGAAEVLSWAERWRAGALLLPRVRPPDEGHADRDLDELRRLHQEARQLTIDGESTRRVEARISRLEATIRSANLRSHGDSWSSPSRFDPAELRRRLGARTLVEYVEFGGRLYAATVVAGSTRLHDLATSEAVEQARRFLLFALRRLLVRPDTGGSGQRARAALDAAAARLDELVLRPVLTRGDGEPAAIVVVPTGALQGVPWACLPSLHARPTTVAPSAQLWASGRPSDGPDEADVLLVAGPDLPGAVDEITRLTTVYPSARVLRSVSATVAATLDGLERCSTAHLAVHGTFRGDSPMFSSLRLADGPLTVYDLERLASTPPTVVLPACDAGVAAVRSGDELLGTATALLHLGVTTVVAPVMPVPDRATADLMDAFHRRLRGGLAPSVALLEAAAEARRCDDPHHLVAAAAFTCIGSDDRRPPAGKPPPAGD